MAEDGRLAQKRRMTMGKSGAGEVPDWKVDVVVAYLTGEFPRYEINHVPAGRQMADLFQVIRGSQREHRLLVRRLFYDYAGHDETSFKARLEVERPADRMRAVGDTIVSE